MTAEEHAVEIRRASDMILRLLAAQKFAEIVTILDHINNQANDIICLRE